jgi:hypothetical protein
MSLNCAPVSDDIATVTACGILSATLAATFHETIGHGLGCYADGGVVTLLTSIWFRCRGGSSLTDAAGPIASLLAGLTGLAVLRKRNLGGAPWLSLVLFTAFSLFWFAAQLVFHALTNGDDWAIIARRHQWPWLWRPSAVVLGIAFYAATIWSIDKALRDNGSVHWHSILIGYAAGMASAVLAGLMWAAMPLRSATEGFLTLGVASLGLLVIATTARRVCGAHRLPIKRSRRLIATGWGLFVAFLFLQGRGIGSLAGTGFLH